MTRLELVTAVRSWLVAASAPGGLSSPDAKVIHGSQTGHRPPKPYLSVEVSTFDQPVHNDESWIDTTATPAFKSRGNRTSIVSVNAFGDGSESWLIRAVMMLMSPDISAMNLAAGVSISKEGSTRNLTTQVGDRFEARFQQDFRVDYTQSETETGNTGVPLEVVEHTDTYTGGVPSDLVISNVEVLP